MQCDDRKYYFYTENRALNWYKKLCKEYKLCEKSPAALICRAKIKPYVVYRLLKVSLD